MKSRNFEFLRPKRSVLADLAGFAEQYAHSDPASSLIKQRGFVEQIVIMIYELFRLRPPFSDNLNDLMNEEAFRQAVPQVVQNKLHTVRKAGNIAAHPRRPITPQMSLPCLADLFDLAHWFHIIDGGDRNAVPKYAAPPPQVDSSAKTKDALEKLRLAEAKYEATLAQLQKETEARLAAERAATDRATELESIKAEGQRVATLLEFSEETTRHRLIDQALLAAGWNVGIDDIVRAAVRIDDGLRPIDPHPRRAHNVTGAAP